MAKINEKIIMGLDDAKYYTRTDAARFLGVTTSKIDALRGESKLISRAIGGHPRVSGDYIKAYYVTFSDGKGGYRNLPNDFSDYFTVPEIMEVLHFNKTKVHTLIDSGAFDCDGGRAVKIFMGGNGGRSLEWRVPRNGVLEYAYKKGVEVNMESVHIAGEKDIDGVKYWTVARAAKELKRSKTWVLSRIKSGEFDADGFMPRLEFLDEYRCECWLIPVCGIARYAKMHGIVLRLLNETGKKPYRQVVISNDATTPMFAPETEETLSIAVTEKPGDTKAEFVQAEKPWWDNSSELFREAVETITDERVNARMRDLIQDSIQYLYSALKNFSTAGGQEQ